MRVGATVFAVCILLSACDNRNSDVAPVMVAGRAVEGITPGAAFLAACTRSYQGIQLVETGASVQKLVQSLRLAPSATVRWERVSPTTYILRLTNNDPLTRQSAEVGMQMDRAIDATASPDCGVGVVDISRITVNGSELQPVGHFDALLSLIDFERLAEEHLAERSQPGASAESMRPSATPAISPPVPITSYEACMSNAVATVDMLDCIAAETEMQDRRLNETYAQLRQSKPDGEFSRIRDEQRDWLARLNQRCATDDEGTMAAVTVADCFLEQTSERADYLNSLR